MNFQNRNKSSSYGDYDEQTRLQSTMDDHEEKAQR